MRQEARSLTSLMHILFIILLLCFGISAAGASASAEELEGNYDYYLQDFVVSAYYSPLPGQVRYLRGSYEKDIRLNGRGTNGADGTEVFEGMLAAPKSYAFGTVIELPGLGVGAVHDRGGAIVEKQNYHRIDVWMGHGDDGLTRALNWGMRNITGKVYFEKDILATNLDYHVIPGGVPQQVAQKKKETKVSLSITKNLEEGMIDSQVVQLKKTLNSLGYFYGTLDNNYFGSDLTAAVMRFQKDQDLITSKTSYGAGHVGLKTRTALSKNITTKNIVVQSNVEQTKMTIQAGLGKDATGEEVKNLQILLSGLGFYDGELSGKYSDDMMAAVFAFQKDAGVVSSISDLGAGYFGAKTKTALENALEIQKKKLAAYPVKKLEVFEGEEKEVVHAAARIAQVVSFPISKAAIVQ